ncbi:MULTISPECIES: hypothetical protein [unclassified Clostridium]|uniref:hypothetical protein n=1 Tax=unclassified Clostridium TaxID=2614128 RepID=UPI0002979D63|nr:MULTISPECIES: hypothetical protein [unclassified Clostridium]EKQ54422.1 MAG: hypothetical protein A370_03246 [Clostridium sp. Maddingley MBC34-26]
MESNNLSRLRNINSRKKMIASKENFNNFKLCTPEMIEKYKSCFNRILKITNDKTKTNYIMYKKVWKWYEAEKNINISMEKIFIKSKLGSCTSGGCGIGASLFAGIAASSIFSYMDNYLKKLGPAFVIIYIVLILLFGIKILSNEDKKVEMYNMFLEILNDLEYDKNEN